MTKILEIRPHHFLCISGYKGYNYNKENADSWSKIIKGLSTNPTQNINVTFKEDDLCKACKHSIDNCSTCDKKYVQKLDEKIKNLLNLKENMIYCYNELMEKLHFVMNPQKHQEICGNCGWRKKGLCNDTFEKK